MKRSPVAVREIELPKVSVLISTYNHERFIARAMESVLCQVTDFDFEIVIGDDCSRDCTTAIVQRFEKDYPGKIRVNRTERNLGMCMNFACAFLMCRGRYIALLEGDDYWTAPHKLQRQADYLDRCSECALVFHQAEVLGKESAGQVIPVTAPPFVTVEDLLSENVIPTCSIMFRRKALTELPIWCANVKMLDWPLCILLMQTGPAAFIAEPMAAYRVHEDGAWSGLPRKLQLESMIDVLQRLDRHFGSRYSATIRRVIAQAYRGMAWCSENHGDLGTALQASWRGTVTSRFTDLRSLRNVLRLLLVLRMPWLYAVTRKVSKRLVSRSRSVASSA